MARDTGRLPITSQFRPEGAPGLVRKLALPLGDLLRCPDLAIGNMMQRRDHAFSARLHNVLNLVMSLGPNQRQVCFMNVLVEDNAFSGHADLFLIHVSLSKPPCREL